MTLSNDPTSRKPILRDSKGPGHDGLAVTAEVKKAKYVYYHRTGYKGKCGLPYMKEETLGRQLGDVLKNIYIPDPVLKDVLAALRSAEGNSLADRRQAQSSTVQRLAALRERMQQAYFDPLDGNIAPEFWSRLQRDCSSRRCVWKATLRHSASAIGASAAAGCGTSSRTGK
jgi:site-specific DNA recombinase